MKKGIFTLLAVCGMYAGVSAQYCGTSGSSVCTPSGTMTAPGLSPNSADLAPITPNIATNTTIQFKNFDTFVLSGQTVTVQSLRVDTISNLPTGLCWATNKTDNTFANQEDGCINVTGTTTGPCGQYKLYIVVTANIGVPIQTNADAAGLKYFVRVVCAGANTPCVDTTAGAFVAYTGTEPACPTGINEVGTNLSKLAIVPNPMNTTGSVTFYSEKAGTVIERISNMIGSVVSEKVMDVKGGNNVSVISRNDLAPGVYFYSLVDGTNVSTKRFVIE